MGVKPELPGEADLVGGQAREKISDPMFRQSGPLDEDWVGFWPKPDPLALSRGSGLDKISDPMLSEFGPKTERWVRRRRPNTDPPVRSEGVASKQSSTLRPCGSDPRANRTRGVASV